MPVATERLLCYVNQLMVNAVARVGMRVGSGICAVAVWLCSATPAFAKDDHDLDSVVIGWNQVWFGESVKSASRKCESFLRARVGWRCTVGPEWVDLIFDQGKLIGISWSISQERYNEVVTEIANRTGVENRHETDQGDEFWGFMQHDEDGKVIGIVIAFAATNDRPAEISHFQKLPKYAYPVKAKNTEKKK